MGAYYGKQYVVSQKTIANSLKSSNSLKSTASVKTIHERTLNRPTRTFAQYKEDLIDSFSFRYIKRSEEGLH